jgi:SAM-dependent methyltransferase
MDDILGQALCDYHFKQPASKLWVYDDFGPRVEMKVPVYFRNWDQMPLLEQIAITECRGKVLDIGAGAGSHALELQNRGFDVTAIDWSAGAARVMQDRGLKNVRHGDIFQFEEGPFDTLLLLMNGIGLSGNISGLRNLLNHFKTLLNPGGQIICDSSDVAYMYEDQLFPTDHYYGEIRCQYAYRRARTEPFTWLYVDFDTMKKVANEEGWNCELLYDDGDNSHLMRLNLVGL